MSNNPLLPPNPHSFRSVAQGFDWCCQHFPNNDALFDMKLNETISYQELQSVVHQAAAHFQRNELVLVSIEEGRDLVAIELGAWTSGACVCPFDLKHDPRAHGIVTRLQPDHIIISSDDETIYPFPTVKANTVINWAGRTSSTTVPVVIDGEALSHMVFTSGTSTGEPKCVGVSNLSLILFALAKQMHSNMTSRSRIFLASSLMFDPQLGDVACALTCGATLVLPNRKDCFASGNFLHRMRESNSTHVTTTPAVLKLGLVSDAVVDLGEAMEEVLVGGERMSPELIARFLQSNKVRLVNTYGVTEACVYQTTCWIREVGDESFLGEAYEGVQYSLLAFDSDAPILREGEEGEIVLTGSFLGRGYLDASTTKRARIFSNDTLGFRGGGTLYRTGDVGVLVKGRGVKLLGRRDTQFKLHGVRFDAEEVECKLVSSTAGMCAAALVTMVGGDEDKQLVACCVFKDEVAAITPKCVPRAMHKLISLALPAAYIPSRFVSIRSLPLTLTGKVDRRQLAIPSIVHIAPTSAPSSSTLESMVRQVWAEVLSISCADITPSDSFQSLGGDSLQALKAVNKLLSRLRTMDGNILDSNTVLSAANAQAQTFGEIEGPFSAVALLSTPSLRAYTLALKPYVSADVVGDDAQPLEAEEEAMDASDPDPALSRALLDAARLGLVHTLAALLTVLDVNGRFQPRKFVCRTPLHESAQFAHLSCIELLLNRGAKVMAMTSARISPLHLAAMAEDATAIQLLIAALRVQRPNDCTPLMIMDANDQTPVHYAARAGRWRVIEALLTESRDSKKVQIKALNTFDRWRRTPLHWAVVNAHVDTVRFLLSRGSKAVPDGMRIGRPGPSTHLVQETPLQCAVRREAPFEIITMLREAELQ